MANQDRSGQLRVATQNLWGRSGNWHERREVLIEGFRELDPDVIALQEVNITADYDQAADILDQALHVARQQKGLVGDGYSVAIASRWPVRRVYELDQHLTPRTADFPCTTMIAEIDGPEPIGTFLFVNHFPSYQLNFEYEREIQTVAAAHVLEEWVERRPAHVVVAGDLDANPGAASIRF
jgi:endonuclease/exonuclease/phosphatase family metal-dependent hydrolase